MIWPRGHIVWTKDLATGQVHYRGALHPKEERGMSKGSPNVVVRVHVDLLAEIDAEVEQSATSRPGEPWTRSSFIISAIREKLAHQRRSRGRARRRSKEAG